MLLFGFIHTNTHVHSQKKKNPNAALKYRNDTESKKKKEEEGSEDEKKKKKQQAETEEMSLSVRERHKWAGALIIDRIIKADEEGFLPPWKIWLSVSSRLASREHAGGSGSGSIRSISAERGSVSHAVPDY